MFLAAWEFALHFADDAARVSERQAEPLERLCAFDARGNGWIVSARGGTYRAGLRSERARFRVFAQIVAHYFEAEPAVEHARTWIVGEMIEAQAVHALRARCGFERAENRPTHAAPATIHV